MVADAELGRFVPFKYLLKIRERFFNDFPENTDFSGMFNYGAGSFNAELKNLMIEYGTPGGAHDDSVGHAKREIDDVKNIMTENIESIMRRGEGLDLLVDKTGRLDSSARDFRVRSRGLKRQMWWKNVKLMGLLGLVLFLIVMMMIISIKNAAP